MKCVETIEAYLDEVGRFRGSGYGRRFRHQFRDTRGTAELAMLAAPSEAEYEEFRRAVEAMTDQEKLHPARLTDEDIRAIARRAGVDCGNVSIFINGFVLASRATGDSVKPDLKKN